QRPAHREPGAAGGGRRARLYRAVNLPILIAVGRALATAPVCALLALANPGSDALALGLFVLAVLSDVADGALARARREVTALGMALGAPVALGQCALARGGRAHRPLGHTARPACRVRLSARRHSRSSKGG